jgi:hypothetical protein
MDPRNQETTVEIRAGQGTQKTKKIWIYTKEHREGKEQKQTVERRNCTKSSLRRSSNQYSKAASRKLTKIDKKSKENKKEKGNYGMNLT